jgi:hypothetical protein
MAEKDGEIWLIGLKDSTELDSPLPSYVHLLNAKTTPILLLFAPKDIRSFIYLYNCILGFQCNILLFNYAQNQLSENRAIQPTNQAYYIELV